MRAYVGADWSGKAVVCAAAVEHGPVGSLGTIPASLDGVRTLVEQLKTDGADSVHVVLQSGAPFWSRLFHSAGAVVHVVDAKQSVNFERSLSSSDAKDDRREARALCELARSPRHCPQAWEPDAHAVLDRLVATHEVLVNERSRATNRLRALLRADMPLVDSAFKFVRSAWVLRFLQRFPTARSVQDVSRKELLKHVSNRVRAVRRAALWDAVQQTRCVASTPVESELHGELVRQLIATIEHFNDQIVATEQRLTAEADTLEESKTIRSIPGIGPALSSSILRYGFASQPQHRDELSIRMGCSPVFRGSGTRRDGSSKGYVAMRRTVASSARRATYMIGLLAVRSHTWARAMYAHGRSKGQTPAAVYRRICRSILRIVYALVRDGRPYDEATYVAALKRRGVIWAADL